MLGEAASFEASIIVLVTVIGHCIAREFRSGSGTLDQLLYRIVDQTLRLLLPVFDRFLVALVSTRLVVSRRMPGKLVEQSAAG